MTPATQQPAAPRRRLFFVDSLGLRYRIAANMPEKLAKWMTETLGVSDSNEFVASAKLAMNDRLTSPFYGYFLISWLIINWRVVYSATLLDQQLLYEKTNLLRNEYVETLVPQLLTFDWFLQLFFGPFALTVLALWLFPYGTRIFYRKYIRNKVANKIIELQELREEKRQETALAKQEVDLLETTIKRAKVEKKAEKESPEVVWEKEYENFKRLTAWSQFPRLIDAIYEHSGLVVDNDGFGGFFKVPREILALSHTSGLVDFDSSKEKIYLTDKGKFFVRKFSEEEGKSPF